MVLQIVEVIRRDRYVMTGKHAEVWKENNGIKPENTDGMEDNDVTKIQDISVQFKKRCADLAAEEMWLQPLKIWELVMDEMLAKFPHEVVVPSLDSVSNCVTGHICFCYIDIAVSYVTVVFGLSAAV